MKDINSKIITIKIGSKRDESPRIIENLLKYGAYGQLIDDDINAESYKTFFEADIDDLLKKNSRVINFNAVRQSEKEKKRLFEKSAFVSNCSDQTLDVNDPEFWNKVLGRVTLLTKYLGPQRYNIGQIIRW